jgi:hypothetical protein
MTNNKLLKRKGHKYFFLKKLGCIIFFKEEKKKGGKSISDITSTLPLSTVIVSIIR